MTVLGDRPHDVLHGDQIESVSACGGHWDLLVGNAAIAQSL
jgi:hypothetical protein